MTFETLTVIELLLSASKLITATLFVVIVLALIIMAVMEE